MNADELREGVTYTDGVSAVRTIQSITSLRPAPGEHDYRSVIYREDAGRNRGRSNTMPIKAFAAFAEKTVRPSQLAKATAALGLDAYSMDERTREICIAAIDTEGLVYPENGDHGALERLVGFGLATRDGPRMRASSYQLSAEIIEAARLTARKMGRRRMKIAA